MEELVQLFTECTREKLQGIKKLPAAGSNRTYYRMSSLHYSLIGVYGESVEENKAFIYLARHFRSKGLAVPEVYVHSKNYLYYLQEDLGEESLFDRIKEGRNSGKFNEKEIFLLKETIKNLPLIQVEGAEGLDYSNCYPVQAFDKRSVFWDLNYFKYCFLKAVKEDFSECALEDDFVKLADVLLSEEQDTFMYRDFQSRNVMLKGDKPYFIDFQGGRKGPFYYDVASFLWQAKASYPEELKEVLLEEYLKGLNCYLQVDKRHFRERLKHFVLFRLLQVLGAYGFRGYFERKPHFLESIPLALENFKRLLEESDFKEYPYLCSVLQEVVLMEEPVQTYKQSDLTVKVYSFSYKKGIPEDVSGNGGGFVFDCRAVHNPGKYDEYKALTGLDKPVVDFLEKDGEIVDFLRSVYALVDASVHRYIERGFSNLQVSFGCTGGQHRSVYSAQHLAEHIYEKFRVRVLLIHREQGIEQLYERKE